ncbi:MAG: sigma-70 family RNA polymerase sigma factor [Bryobacteraceae bacterium]|nr:sigma-70 family RNA polymerase sigma factor [Bryobacteraceae bacterium]
MFRFRAALRYAPGETFGTFRRLTRKYHLRNEQEFWDIYERNQPGLYRYALHLTRDRAQADDIVQETFLALIRKPNAWDPERGGVRSYLYGVVRNQARRYWDERHSGELPEDLPAPERMFDDLARRESEKEVRSAVATVPSVYRDALRLCDIEEKSYDEAAAALDLPVGTVRSRLSRGRALLGRKLKARRWWIGALALVPVAAWIAFTPAPVPQRARTPATEFLVLDPSVLSGVPDGYVMRMKVPGATLRQLGMPLGEEMHDTRIEAQLWIEADVLLGNDGRARAIRLVSQ